MDLPTLMSLPDVRFKVLRVLEGQTDAELSDRDLAGFESLIDAFATADSLLDEVVKRFPREHYRLFVRPAVFQLPQKDAIKLVQLLEERCSVKLDDRTAAVRFSGKLYLVGVELPCG